MVATASTTAPGWSAPATGALRQGATGDGGSFSARKEQQLVFLLVRQLAAAQFIQAQPPLVARLWQEVAALEIDPERILWLLYGGQDLDDRQGLAELDQLWQSRQEQARRRNRGGRWWRRPAHPFRPAAAGHRSAPPAAAPARPAGR